MISQGKALNSLFLISALSDYPISLYPKGFDNKLRKIEIDAFSAISFNQAY
jgi:hypothetical protein